MQRKTIQKAISNKLEEWLQTITDEDLRKDVKKELLVSGGSITSLFLNEPVNDFDVYIKTPETCFKLAEYYAKAFDAVTVFLGKNKEQYLRNFKEEDKGIEKIFFENMHPEQVKLWLWKDAGYKTEFTDEGLCKYLPLYFSPNAISLSDKIQIVLRFTGDNEQIHKSFDFIHATNYFTLEKGLVTNLKALESILSKQLYYQGSLYPLTSVIRTKKFLGRHWKITAGEYLKMMFQISQLDLTDFNVLEEQISGVDVAYFSKLIEILREHKYRHPEFQFTYEYLCSIIDRVFNETEEDK